MMVATASYKETVLCKGTIRNGRLAGQACARKLPVVIPEGLAYKGIRIQCPRCGTWNELA